MAESPPVGNGWKLLERESPTGSGRKVCVANQKGGVAKTTTVVNLAAGLALKGRRVLVVDVDPQANATTGVGVDHRVVAASTYDLMLGEATLQEVTVQTGIAGLECAPASQDLAGAEVELVSSLQREHQLADALTDAASHYDMIFLDCPPSLGLLTVNALVAADDLIVPVQCEYYALEGLGQMLETAERVRRVLNPGLRIAGFLLTMYDARTNLSAQVGDEVRGHFGDLVFRTVVPRSVRLSEAPSFGEPVLTLDPASRGSISYRLLADEVEELYRLNPEPPPPPDPVPRGETVAAPGDVPPVEPVRAALGPAGRGYGTVAPEPPGLDEAWPPASPWTESPTRPGER